MKVVSLFYAIYIYFFKAGKTVKIFSQYYDYQDLTKLIEITFWLKSIGI